MDNVWTIDKLRETVEALDNEAKKLKYHLATALFDKFGIPTATAEAVSWLLIHGGNIHVSVEPSDGVREFANFLASLSAKEDIKASRLTLVPSIRVYSNKHMAPGSVTLDVNGKPYPFVISIGEKDVVP